MSSESKFWISVWLIVGATIVSIVAVASSHYEQNHQDIIKMVNAGYSPIEAACAVDDGMGMNPTCVVLASRNKKIK